MSRERADAGADGCSAEAGFEPSVAVVIPVYNAGRLLERSISSVLAQGCPRVQVIVIDDGSTDDSLDIARGFGDAIELASIPNGGACRARNEGLKRARAPYVKFLDADDRLEGPILQDAVEVAERTGADIVLSPNLLIDAAGVRTERNVFAESRDRRSVFEGWLYGRCVNTASVLWRRSFVEAIGGWDERVLINQDGELLLRALIHGARIAEGLRGVGVYHRDQPGSISLDVTRRKRDNYVDTLRRLALSAQGTEFADAFGAAHRILYSISRAAFAEGDVALGRKAEGALREIGCQAHFGTTPHVVAASLIGLEKKVLIGRWMANALTRRRPT